MSAERPYCPTCGGPCEFEDVSAYPFDEPPGFRRRYIALLIVLVTLLAILLGCAIPSRDFRWDSAPTSAPLAMVELVTVRPESIFGVCYDARSNCSAPGCSQRDYAANVCRIYITIDAPDWVIEHEVRHCEGWEHD